MHGERNHIATNRHEEMRRTDEEKPGTSSAVGLATLPLARKQVLRLRLWSATGTEHVYE
jgi:hypothetical protein